MTWRCPPNKALQRICVQTTHFEALSGLHVRTLARLRTSKTLERLNPDFESAARCTVCISDQIGPYPGRWRMASNSRRWMHSPDAHEETRG